jgi:uncharacterized iron-regulated protein
MTALDRPLPSQASGQRHAWRPALAAAAWTALAASVMLVVAVAGATASPLHPLCAHAPDERARLGTLGRDLCAIVEVAGPEGRAVPWQGGPESRPPGMAAADILLLGEVHDNPLHHRYRADYLLQTGWHQQALGTPPPAVVLEHVRADQHLALAGFRALDRKRRADARTFFEAMQWERSGWPDARMFAPLIDAVLDLAWPMLPGNVTRDQIRAVARNGISALDSDERTRLRLDEPLPGPLQAALLSELEASHCGLLPKSAFSGLAEAQRYRDAFMARALADAAETHGSAILLAGNGHVRSDRGVPFHLRRIAPGRRITSVLFLEVEERKTELADYVERGPDGKAIADYIYLTMRPDRPDPCVEMRRLFRK